MKDGSKNPTKQMEIKFPDYPSIKDARKSEAEKRMKTPIKDKADDLWEKPTPWYNH